MIDLCIHNVTTYIDGSWRTSSLSVDAGKIVSFDRERARLVVDAEGKRCLPGAVDLHVHFNEPGRTHWEGFATGALAAAAGGATFVVEMPLNSIPSTVSTQDLATKLSAIASKSMIDFGLWGGLVPGNVNQIAPLAKAGVAGFKAFMSPSGTDDFQNSDYATLKAGMKEIAHTGKLLAIHAEDPQVLDTVDFAGRTRISAFDWEYSRPVEAEIKAVEIAMELSQETGCPIHIVHVSSPAVLDRIALGKQAGVKVTCETCPHYLLLSTEDAHRIGPNAKCAPPLRPEETRLALWQALDQGKLDTIGSDHSPCPPDMKTGSPFYDAWGGISGLQHGLPLLWNFGRQDEARFAKLISLTCAQPSALISLPNKGALKIGYDADFVLVEELPSPLSIDADSLLYRHRHSAYCGLKTRYRISETWQRGRCLLRDGKAVAPPAGTFIAFN
ncbi:allantoinase AllB [Pelagicoccus sp. SDUM812003]|uniref:allantoinase AllB n=1 Tax=Pelagicoccus sp. SDUM812003 TaxID=3041267 RepID=UPI00280E4B31|nr:allantoinase AllB [Pelagicoccus sp. SDUM812003]MDQ8205470.1 allantoinase AllB [Pelagicoccus sp. SDUM812003]